MSIETIQKQKLPIKTKHFFNYSAFLLIGLMLGFIVHFSIGCADSFNFDRDKVPIDEEGIKRGALAIETLFLDADTIALSDILTETSLMIYRPTFQDIKPYMQEFGQAFKSRKLIYANQIFAVYEFKDGSNKHTVEMTLGDDRTWKLTRF